MKRLALLLILLLSAPVTAQPAVNDNADKRLPYYGDTSKTALGGTPDRNAPRGAKAASVKIVNRTSAGPIQGSGTVVAVGGGKALVITCYHLFQDDRNNDRFVCGTITITFPGGQSVAGKFVSHDKFNCDLAAVSFDTAALGGDAAIPAVAVADSPQLSRGVWHFGYARGSLVARTGSITRNGDTLHATFGSIEGESGGGIFRSDGRALVGVLWGKRNDTGQALGVPRAETRRFAESAWTCLRTQVVVVPQPQLVYAPQPAAQAVGPDPYTTAALAQVLANQQIISAKIDALKAATPCPGCSGGTNPPAVLLPTPPPAVLPTYPTPPPAVSPLLPTPPSIGTLPTPPRPTLPTPPAYPMPPATMLPTPPPAVIPMETGGKGT